MIKRSVPVTQVKIVILLLPLLKCFAVGHRRVTALVELGLMHLPSMAHSKLSIICYPRHHSNQNCIDQVCLGASVMLRVRKMDWILINTMQYINSMTDWYIWQPYSPVPDSPVDLCVRADNGSSV